MDKVKQQCEGVANNLIKKLEQCFLEHQILTTLSMVYLQFWARNPVHADEEFHRQLNVLKATFCAPHMVGEFGKVVLPYFQFML